MSRQSEAQKRVQARLKAQKEKQAKDTPRVNRRGRRLSVKNRVLPAEMVGAISPEEMAKIVKEIRTESKESKLAAKPATKPTTAKPAAKPAPKPASKATPKPAASKPASAPKSDKKRKSIADTLKELKKMKRASKERQGKEPKMQGVGPYRSAKKYTAKMAGQPAKPAQAAKPNTKSKLRQAMEERMKKRRGRGY